MTADEIVAQALGLSPDARVFLAEKLIESLDMPAASDLSGAWREEIRKRCREMDEGIVQLRRASDVFAKAHETLR